MAYYDPNVTQTPEQVFGEVAADLVQRYAPVPDPEPADYPDKAARAEYLVRNYLINTSGGSLASASLARGGSMNFASMSKVQSLVRSVMGAYAAGQGTTGTLTVDSSFPNRYTTNGTV